MYKRDSATRLRVLERWRVAGRAVFILIAALLGLATGRSGHATTFVLTTASVADIYATFDPGEERSY